MLVKRIISDMLESNMYLLIETGHMLVIDPCRYFKTEGNIADLIILTHEHYDHISGVNLWKEKTGARVLGSKACADNCMDSKKNMSRHFEAFCQIQTFTDKRDVKDIDKAYTCEVDDTFTGTSGFDWRGNNIRLFELPGHSMGSIGILVNNKLLFSGDSIWKNEATACGFPGGSMKMWSEISEPVIDKLPGDITVYPGHGETFRLSERGMKDANI